MTDEQKVREAVYQRQAGNGSWIDITREQYEKAMRGEIGHDYILACECRVLYTHPPRAAEDARDAERYRHILANHLQLWVDTETGEPASCNFDFEARGTHDISQAIEQAIAGKRGG